MQKAPRSNAEIMRNTDISQFAGVYSPQERAFDSIQPAQRSQFSSYDWQAFLKAHNSQQSMSRRGNCHDNVIAESFFQLLKRECIRRKIYSTREKQGGMCSITSSCSTPRRKSSWGMPRRLCTSPALGSPPPHRKCPWGIGDNLKRRYGYNNRLSSVDYEKQYFERLTSA
jgi:putative transposase